MSKTQHNLLIWDDSREDKVRINEDLALNFFQEKGFPMEMFEEEVNRTFRENPSLRALHISKAYDAAHGTNFEGKLAQLIEQHG